MGRGVGLQHSIDHQAKRWISQAGLREPVVSFGRRPVQGSLEEIPCVCEHTESGNARWRGFGMP
jgi:hypothetical protein